MTDEQMPGRICTVVSIAVRAISRSGANAVAVCSAGWMGAVVVCGAAQLLSRVPVPPNVKKATLMPLNRSKARRLTDCDCVSLFINSPGLDELIDGASTAS